MGFGDYYHKHLLKLFKYVPAKGANCSRCETPITSVSYGCTICNYFIHKTCTQLPETMRHPLHQEHPLTLLAPTTNLSLSNATNANTTLCNECHDPCLGFVYHCSTCRFNLHIKCFLTFKYPKHEHLVRFKKTGTFLSMMTDKICQACGSGILGVSFDCEYCKFYIHHVCTILPQIVKHHHVHELTFNHNFPDECDQVYCDRCEDRDGHELDRRLSYYYCKRCDYIAHVRCITNPEERIEQIEHFIHEHPLRLLEGRWFYKVCKACGIDTDDVYYHCIICDCIFHKSCLEFPSLVQHPLHKGHTLTLKHPTSLNNERKSDDMMLLHCTDCDYTVDLKSALMFKHPNFSDDLWFTNRNGTFQCDACGKLGECFRMQSVHKSECFDLHLECFALPGEISHECHPHHPLFLFSRNVSATSQCNVCNKEADPELWVYCCQVCNFVAHLNCVAGDILSNIRSLTKNSSDFCAIIQYEETLFDWKGTSSEPKSSPESVCFILSHKLLSRSLRLPVLFSAAEVKPVISRDDGQGHVDCPQCGVPVFRQDYSEISELSTCIESSTLSEEQLFEETHCPVCTILIFPPFYYCAECKSYFHDLCAKLPRTHEKDSGHTFELVAPDVGTLSKCSFCNKPITSFAYVCQACRISLDVACACSVPLMEHRHFRTRLCIESRPSTTDKCIACGTHFSVGMLYFNGYIYANKPVRCIHIECALLPLKVKHRIHKHPLELASNLADLDDEYICDVCEKDLNPMLWAYRCSDSCGVYATSHVTCVISSKLKCHFRYEEECRNMTEAERLEAEARYAFDSNSKKGSKNSL